jgi:hypothetical protein
MDSEQANSKDVPVAQGSAEGAEVLMAESN